RKMSPMLPPQTITSSSPASSATPFSPAGDISRDDPMAKRSPATTNVSPACTRARKSGIRYRNDPAFHFSSSDPRLSDTQSEAGVIWSVSIASSFSPARFGSQKISAFPRMSRAPPDAAPAGEEEDDEEAGEEETGKRDAIDSKLTPGLSRAGVIGVMQVSARGTYPTRKRNRGAST